MVGRKSASASRTGSSVPNTRNLIGPERVESGGGAAARRRPGRRRRRRTPIVIMMPLPTSRYATESMPAIAVYATQNAAVMSAPVCRIDVGDEIQQPAAAAKLIGGDRRVRDDDRDRAEDARRRPVAHLQDVRHGVLRDAPHPRRDEIDERDPDPRARRLPQRRKPGAIAEPRAAEQAPRPDPRREQREHQHARRQRPPGHEEVVARFSLPRRPDAGGDEDAPGRG